jgi:hypothetical protein
VPSAVIYAFLSCFPPDGLVPGVRVGVADFEQFWKRDLPGNRLAPESRGGGGFCARERL